MKIIATLFLLMFSYQTLATQKPLKVQEDPCLSVHNQFLDAGKIVELDESALMDNADMLNELADLNDPKVNAIIVPHVAKQIAFLEQANKVREKYQK